MGPLPWEGLEQRKRVRSPPPEEEGAAKTTCDELTAASLPRPGWAAGREEIENLGVKLNLKRGVGVWVC